jgi:hypothetical protein
MPKIKLHSKPKPVRLSVRCMNAWEYLATHKVNAVHYLREGGEQAVINKANDFYFKEKRNKLYPNAPSWAFDN